MCWRETERARHLGHGLRTETIESSQDPPACRGQVTLLMQLCGQRPQHVEQTDGFVNHALQGAVLVSKELGPVAHLAHLAHLAHQVYPSTHLTQTAWHNGNMHVNMTTHL
jgi:hypothetical protein